MNTTTLDKILNLDILPKPFIVKDKFVLLKHLDVTETVGLGTPDQKLIVATSDGGSRQTIHAEVVGLPNFERGHYADGFALGDIVMVHPMVGNKILLDGREFQVARGDEIVGWYEMGANDPLVRPELRAEFIIPFAESKPKSKVKAATKAD